MLLYPVISAVVPSILSLGISQYFKKKIEHRYDKKIIEIEQKYNKEMKEFGHKLQTDIQNKENFHALLRQLISEKSNELEKQKITVINEVLNALSLLQNLTIYIQFISEIKFTEITEPVKLQEKTQHFLQVRAEDPSSKLKEITIKMEDRIPLLIECWIGGSASYLFKLCIMLIRCTIIEIETLNTGGTLQESFYGADVVEIAKKHLDIKKPSPSEYRSELLSIYAKLETALLNALKENFHNQLKKDNEHVKRAINIIKQLMLTKYNPEKQDDAVSASKDSFIKNVHV